MPLASTTDRSSGGALPGRRCAATPESKGRLSGPGQRRAIWRAVATVATVQAPCPVLVLSSQVSGVCQNVCKLCVSLACRRGVP